MRNPRRALAVYPGMRIQTDDWCMQGERETLRDLLVRMLPAEPSASQLAKLAAAVFDVEVTDFHTSVCDEPNSG